MRFFFYKKYCNTIRILSYARYIAQVPINSQDNALAIDQMEVAYLELLSGSIAPPDIDAVDPAFTRHLALDGIEHPRVVTYDYFSRSHKLQNSYETGWEAITLSFCPYFVP